MPSQVRLHMQSEIRKSLNFWGSGTKVFMEAARTLQL